MKKILILTVTAGNGHNACARGMKNKLESYGDCEVKTVDLLKCYSTKLNVWTSDRGYCLAVSKLPKLYNLFYDHYLKLDPKTRYRGPSKNTVLSTLNGLLKEISEYRPDVIYCTHFYGAIAVTFLKLVYNLPCKSVVSNLDYVNSPFWESCIGVDYFAIPNEDFTEECVREGFNLKQLYPIGMPVDARTLEDIDKKEARRLLNLDPDLFTVTVMFGGGYWSGGFKIFKGIIKALEGRNAQIIMINGKNEKSFKKIAKMKFPKGLKIVNVGFTTDVPVYYAASDVAVNKYGGTSVTEMINKKLPMLITAHLAAQENYNLLYMKKKGAALSFKNNRELKEKLLKLMDSPEKRREMSQKCEPLIRNGAENLAELILSQPDADYTEFLKQNIDYSKVKSEVAKALKAADKKERKKK